MVGVLLVQNPHHITGLLINHIYFYDDASLLQLQMLDMYYIRVKIVFLLYSWGGAEMYVHSYLYQASTE